MSGAPSAVSLWRRALSAIAAAAARASAPGQEKVVFDLFSAVNVRGLHSLFQRVHDLSHLLSAVVISVVHRSE